MRLSGSSYALGGSRWSHRQDRHYVKRSTDTGFELWRLNNHSEGGTILGSATTSGYEASNHIVLDANGAGSLDFASRSLLIYTTPPPQPSLPCRIQVMNFTFPSRRRYEWESEPRHGTIGNKKTHQHRLATTDTGASNINVEMFIDCSLAQEV